MMKTDGTSQTSVGSPDNFTFVRLSPDGKKIVFSYLDSSSASQVGLINADGFGRTNLTLPPQQPNPNYPEYPQFTPDGTKIIYQSLNGHTEYRHDQSGWKQSHLSDEWWWKLLFANRLARRQADRARGR
jgi:Tol biopolymer transport system component